jgi:RNA polymerase sigma-70 factor (ECF subfamily)
VDEQAFIEAIRAARPDAFQRLVEREVDPVFRLAYRILGNSQDAEDVVQDTFVIAYRSIDTFRGEGSIGAWLRSIAARLAVRHATRRSSAPSVDVLEMELSDTQAVPGISGPLAGVLSDERAAAIRHAIALLPEGQREVIALRFFGELTLPEIAETTGRPLPTCKSHLRRGLVRLRDTLRTEVAA